MKVIEGRRRLEDKGFEFAGKYVLVLQLPTNLLFGIFKIWSLFLL